MLLETPGSRGRYDRKKGQNHMRPPTFQPPSNAIPTVACGGAAQLCFSTHALVRFIERHVNSQAVEILRRQGLDDHQVLNRLKIRFATELEALVERAMHSFAGHAASIRRAMNGMTYILNVGDVPLRICGDVCVTIMPAHWNAARLYGKYRTPRTWRRRCLDRLKLEAA
jgi:hypothetical protein